MDQADQLLKVAAEGDAEAFCRVVAMHERWLFQRAWAIGGDFHLAEDLTQETMLEAWKSLRRYNGTCRFTTWLYSILLHRHKKSLSHAGRTRLRLGIERSPAEMDDLPDPAAARAIASIPDRELAEHVRAAIDKLARPMRIVVLMRFFGQATVAEMSNILGIPEGTVKSRLHYALDRLREMLPKQ